MEYVSRMDEVNLVFPHDGWILERMGQEIKKYIPEIDMNGPGDAVNYYINYMLYFDHRKPGKSVALYTHLEDSGKPQRRFLSSSLEVDVCVAMSGNTADILREHGAKDVRVIHGGVPSRESLKFGVSGRVYSSKRKGEFLVERMVEAGYDVKAVGTGWPCPEVSEEEFWGDIDYYVVTSLNEGGPFGILAALAHGIPVIAPDVGWCWEYCTIGYDKGDWSSLLAVLKGLQPRLWEEWAADHKKLFEEILNDTR